jgi:hypothetical protein
VHGGLSPASKFGIQQFLITVFIDELAKVVPDQAIYLVCFCICFVLFSY